MSESESWSGEFTIRAARRVVEAESDWSRGCRLHPAVARSLQKFQVGESGDGAHLISEAEAAGDPDYALAVSLFVAEEQNHARMLAALLRSAGVPLSGRHWSDTVFVQLRRLLGLRLELMVLAIAEIVALRYYRALADGSDDALLAEVTERILDDERRHVPFHCRRLSTGFAGAPAGVGRVIRGAWRALALAVVLVVAVEHGPALRVSSVTRRAFVSDTLRLFDNAAAAVFTPSQAPDSSPSHRVPRPLVSQPSGKDLPWWSLVRFGRIRP